MKIFVKTLKGTNFEVQVKPDDTVSDVKKTIENVQGADVYPASQQMLIYQGKVLKDTTTLGENNIAENSFIVVMLTKNKPAAAAASSASATLVSQGIPEQGEVPPIARAPATTPVGGQAGNPPTQAPQAVSTGPNASPLDLFPQGLPNVGTNAGAGSLGFLHNSQQFQTLRAMVQANPQILQPMLQELGKQNPQLMRLIREHQADFLRLINEPVEGEGNLLSQLASAMPHTLSVTPEEREAIERGKLDEASRQLNREGAHYKAKTAELKHVESRRQEVLKELQLLEDQQKELSSQVAARKHLLQEAELEVHDLQGQIDVLNATEVMDAATKASLEKAEADIKESLEDLKKFQWDP